MIQKYSGNSGMADRMKSDALRGGRILRSILAFNPADDFFVRRKQVAISIGWDALQIAHGSCFWNQIHVMGYKTYPFREDQYPLPETVASMASLYVGQHHLLHPRVMLCVPKAWSVIQTTELPTAAKENLSDVIAFELDRITPFTSEEAYYDFRVLEEGGEKLKVAVAAMRKDAVIPYIQALSDKGLPVSHIDMNLSAVGTYLNYVYREQDVVYLDIGSKYYEGGFMQSGVMTTGCAGSFNGRGLDESLLADIAAEMKPWMQSNEALKENPRLLVHLNNGMSCSGLERQLPWPVNVLKDGDLTIPGFKGEKNTENVPHAAIGGVIASLWPKTKAYNFLRKGKAQSEKAPLALTIFLLIALLAMGLLALTLPLYMENQRIAAIEREIAARKESIKKVELLRKEYAGLNDEGRTIAGFKQGKPLATDILRELTTILPKSVWLTRVHVAEAAINIEGYATAATDILPLIEASPYFAKVEFTSPTIRDTRINADRFVIRMEIEGSKREEPKAKNGKKQ
jgi:general secretion pathway protein L